MTGWWLADYWSVQNGQVIVVSWLVWVVASITLHELGHGWAAIRLGDDTPIRTGHMTWNPIVHMGPYSLIMLLLIGIAWGAMPVDPTRLRGRYGDTLVSLAGPGVNLILAIVLTLCAAFWTPLAHGWVVPSIVIDEPLRTNLAIFFGIGAMLNVVLMCFNLIPIPPLDGGRVAVSLMPSFRRLMLQEHGRWLALGAFIILIVFGADFLFAIADLLVFGIVDIVADIFAPSAP